MASKQRWPPRIAYSFVAVGDEAFDTPTHIRDAHCSGGAATTTMTTTTTAVVVAATVARGWQRYEPNTL